MSTRPAANAAAPEDIADVEAPVRRVVRARVSDEHIADDVVQETLTRLLEARWRLDREALVAYGIVTARNLVSEHERARGVERRNAHRLVGAPTAPSPDEEALLAEEHEALRAGLGRLESDDRRWLMEHSVDDVSVAKMAAEEGVTSGAMAARLARARARLRVEHLLAFRRAAPASAGCRPVLEALSLGDRRRQAVLHAGEHLLDCRTCGPLAEPLLHRRRQLAAVAGPLAALAALPTWVRQHAVSSATAAGAAGAVVVAVVASGGDRPAPGPAPAQAPPVTSRAVVPAGSPLTVGGTAVQFDEAKALRSRVGEPAVAVRAPVLDVPADEGFWIGLAPGRRVWVQLSAGSESPQRIRPGTLVSFRATVAAAPMSPTDRFGLDPSGAAELRSTGAYLQVQASTVGVG